MITAVETKLRFKENPDSWKTALWDFVGDFRKQKNPTAITDPFELGDERKDAVLASSIETLCDELKIDIPEWLYEIPSCKHPYFVAGDDDLMAIAIVQSPVRFRIRKVFVLENFLFRV